jgi:hypothetical protein
MIARLVWWAALLVVAVVTIGVQLDRQAMRNPLIAASVPEPFRASAQVAVAAFALEGDDPARSLAEAQRLIRRRPLPAEHLRLLAQAQFANGDPDASALTLQYAAQRGWREPLVQEAMLQLALAVGDQAEAARRYAALLVRNDTDNGKLIALGPAVMSEPGSAARQTLIEIIGGSERWHGAFLRRGAMVMPPDAFAEIVNATAANGVGYECGGLMQSETLVRARDSAAADIIAAVGAKRC